jgi:hypothetical protein
MHWAWNGTTRRSAKGLRAISRRDDLQSQAAPVPRLDPLKTLSGLAMDDRTLLYQDAVVLSSIRYLSTNTYSGSLPCPFLALLIALLTV